MNKKDCYTKEEMLDYINRQEDTSLFCPYCHRVMVHVIDDPEGEYWYCRGEYKEQDERL